MEPSFVCLFASVIACISTHNRQELTKLFVGVAIAGSVVGWMFSANVYITVLRVSNAFVGGRAWATFRRPSTYNTRTTIGIITVSAIIAIVAAVEYAFEPIRFCATAIVPATATVVVAISFGTSIIGFKSESTKSARSCERQAFTLVTMITVFAVVRGLRAGVVRKFDIVKCNPTQTTTIATFAIVSCIGRCLVWVLYTKCNTNKYKQVIQGV